MQGDRYINLLSGAPFTIYMYQVIICYTLNVIQFIWQLHLKKAGEKKKSQKKIKVQ